jgi:predicted TIM-barrel fold metal-dependent hydrolase
MTGLAAACDCHVHIVGPTAEFPQDAARTYTAAPAPAETLIDAAAPHGITRFVVVQPSFYGTDNRCTLSALARLGDRGRGVAVLAPDTDAAALRRLDALGIRSVRLNLYSTISQRAAVGNSLGPIVALAARAGWHLELIAPLATLRTLAAQVAAAPVPVVLDHYGLFGNATPDDADGAALLDLLARPHVWMKLSAPYRVSPDALATRPPAAWLNALLKAAPDRCVWGSDWPHTPPHAAQTGTRHTLAYRAIAYADLVHDFVAAVGDPAALARILVENPGRLYGFPPA